LISFFEEVRISQPEFEAALQACNKKSALGNDGISNKLIYHSPSNIKSLTLFQFSLKQGHIPNSWKLAKIIMAHKKGKPKQDFTSYRPISLLNCLAKLLEKIINNKLTKWAEQYNV